MLHFHDAIFEVIAVDLQLLGRVSADAQSALAPYAGRYVVAFVIAGGLSARAVQTPAAALSAALLPVLQRQGLRSRRWSLHAMAVCNRWRCRGDLGVRSVAILIGRPAGCPGFG